MTRPRVCQHLLLGSMFSIFSLSATACKTRSFNTLSVKSQSDNTQVNFKSYLEEVPIAEKEEVVQVANAQIAVADYDLIRKDFPATKVLSDEQIDQYLLANYAFFSKKHIDFTKQSTGYRINTPIPTGEAQKLAIRPPFYGRALMIPGNSNSAKSDPITNDPKRSAGETKIATEDAQGPLIDAKGAGNPEPESVEDHHGNGQAYFGEAMREYHFQKLVQMIFDAEGKGWKTNPVYGVILFPFSAEHDFNAQLRSALILRKGEFRHGRHTNHGGFVFYSREGELQADAFQESSDRELALRKYGLTSTVELDTDGKNWFDAVNLQFTGNKTLIDFGSFGVLDTFKHPLKFCNPQYKGDPNKESEPIRFTGFNMLDCPYTIAADAPHFVAKPTRELAVPKNLWGLGPVTELAINLIPADKRPKKREQFMDNPSLSGVWLSTAFDVSLAEGKKEAHTQHCRLMMPMVQKLKMNAQKVPTVAKCKNTPLAWAEAHIQIQATLGLAKLVNRQQLQALIHEKFSALKIENITDKSHEIGDALKHHWQNFMKK